MNAPDPSTRTLTRLATVAVLASCVSAAASVTTAAIALKAYVDAKALRAQLDDSLGALMHMPSTFSPPQSSASPVLPPSETAVPAVDVAAFDALPPVPPVALSRAALADGNDLVTQARIVPSFEGGVTTGFKLFGIRPGSAYATAGLQNGDVVMRLNGKRISTPDEALAVYSSLKDAKGLRVDVSRRGTPVRIDLALTP